MPTDEAVVNAQSPLCNLLAGYRRFRVNDSRFTRRPMSDAHSAAFSLRLS
jgi:hypothetical protein